MSPAAGSVLGDASTTSPSSSVNGATSITTQIASPPEDSSTPTQHQRANGRARGHRNQEDGTQ